MCGRYTVTATPEVLRALFRYEEQPNFPPRFNIAPTQPIAVVRLMDGKRQFALMRWGLLPSWVKDPKKFTLLINARGESVTEKPAFRTAMKRRRCLIPADGFYEWKALGGRKQPFYIRAKDGARSPSPDCGRPGPDPTAKSSTPRPSSPPTPTRHWRRSTTACRWWCRRRRSICGSTAPMSMTSPPSALIQPAQEELFEAYPISTDVNRVANDNPKLIERFVPMSAPKPVAPSARQAPSRRRAGGVVLTHVQFAAYHGRFAPDCRHSSA